MLKTICDHTNNVSLSDSCVHRNRKRKNPEHDNQGGLFAIPSASPVNKKGRIFDEKIKPWEFLEHNRY